MLSGMETAARTQTVIRLKPELMERVKYRAKGRNLSVNAYVESVLEEATKAPIPKLPREFKSSPAIERLSGIIPAPSREMLESDEKLAYILGK